MKTTQAFDPTMRCSSGVCGVDVDQALVIFSEDVAWAKERGIHQITAWGELMKTTKMTQNCSLNSNINISYSSDKHAM